MAIYDFLCLVNYGGFSAPMYALLHRCIFISVRKLIRRRHKGPASRVGRDPQQVFMKYIKIVLPLKIRISGP